MGVLQDAADLARVYLHSAAMGVPEWAESHFGNPANVQASNQAVAQSRTNTGMAGNVANVAGYFAPGGVLADAVRGIKAIPAAARAIPTAERAAMNFLNPARANAYARLGMGEVPTVVGPAIGNVASNIADYVGSHKLLTAAALGGGTLAALAGGTSATPPAAAPTKTATQNNTKQSAAQTTNQAAATNQGPAPNPTFSQLASMAAAANGGKLSIDQLGALSEIAARTAPPSRLAPITPQSLAIAHARTLSDQIAATQRAAAQAANDKDAYLKATQDQYEREANLGKASPYDPLSPLAFQGGTPQ